MKYLILPILYLILGNNVHGQNDSMIQINDAIIPAEGMNAIYANEFFVQDTSVLLKPTKPQQTRLKQILGEKYDKNNTLVVPGKFEVVTTSGRRIKVQPVITSRNMMKMNYNRKTMEGSFTMMLLSQTQTSENKLRRQQNIAIVGDDMNFRGDPESEFDKVLQLKFENLNLPLRTIEVTAENASDSIDFKIITEDNPEGIRFHLLINPYVKVDAPASLQGMGIGEKVVHVSLHGSNKVSDEKIVVSTKSSSGQLESEEIILSNEETSPIFLRSSGTDDIKLSVNPADDSISVPSEITIRQVFPWIFILAAVLGGITGSLIKIFYSSNFHNVSTKLAGAALFGFIVAIAYYVLGINLLKMTMSEELNEFAVFGISALSSLILNPLRILKKT